MLVYEHHCPGVFWMEQSLNGSIPLSIDAEYIKARFFLSSGLH